MDENKLSTILAVTVCVTGINFVPFLEGRYVKAEQEQQQENYETMLEDGKVYFKK